MFLRHVHAVLTILVLFTIISPSLQANFNFSMTGELFDSDSDGKISLNDRVDYEIVIVNDGLDVLVDTLEITDPFAVVDPPCRVVNVRFAAGDEYVCRPYWLVTQNALDDGSFTNVASYLLFEENGVSDVDTDMYTPFDSDANMRKGLDARVSVASTDTTSFTITLSSFADMDLTTVGTFVDSDMSGRPNAGDIIQYLFFIRNNGTVTLTNVTVEDFDVADTGDFVGSVCSIQDIPSGGSSFCVGEYVLTSADITAGGVESTATAKAKHGVDDLVASDTHYLSLPILPVTGQLSFTTIFPNVSGTGIDTSYSVEYEVRNDGEGNIQEVEVFNGKGVSQCIISSVIPAGGTGYCTGGSSYVVTQEDVDRGYVTFTAKVVAIDSTTSAQLSDTQSLTAAVPISNDVLLEFLNSIMHDINDDSVDSSGDLLLLSFNVTNAGDQTIFQLSISTPDPDHVVNFLLCDLHNILPGQSTTCDASYILTQADVDSGSVSASSVATAAFGFSFVRESSAFVDWDVPLDGTTTASIEKSALFEDLDSDGFASAGDEIDYTLTVMNTGTRTVNSYIVTDDLASLSCTNGGNLLPGKVSKCEYSYEIQQSDLEKGSVLNTASLDIITPTGPISMGSVSVNTYLARDSGVSLLFSSSIVSFPPTVSYNVTFINHGSSSIEIIDAVDTLRAIEGTPCETALNRTVAAGETVTCDLGDFDYVPTQDEIDIGQIANKLTLSIQRSSTVQTISDSTTTFLPSAAISVSNFAIGITSIEIEGDSVSAGDIAIVEFSVDVLTSQSLSSVIIDTSSVQSLDCIFEGTELSSPSVSAESYSCTGNYTIRGEDIVAAEIVIFASAKASTVGGQFSSISSKYTYALAVVPADGDILLTISSQVISVGPTVKENDLVEFVYTAYSQSPESTQPHTLNIYTVGSNMPLCVLKPWDFATEAQIRFCTEVVQLSQTQLDEQVVVRDMELRQCPLSNTNCKTDNANATVYLDVAKGISVDMTHAPTSGLLELYDILEFHVSYTNIGDQTIWNGVVTDSLTNSLECTFDALAPGATESCPISVQYNLTQRDINRGFVVNAATIMGEAGNFSEPVTDTDEDVALLEASNTFVFEKSGAHEDLNMNGYAERGEYLVFNFSIRNTGSQTISSATIYEQAPVDLDFECAFVQILPGTEARCLGYYTLTQNDINEGNVSNIAIARVVFGEDDVKELSASDFVEFNTLSGGSLEKTGRFIDSNMNGVADTSDQIMYVFRFRNEGGTTLTDVRITDSLLGSLTNCEWDVVLSDVEEFCGPFSYNITLDDVDAQERNNVAVAEFTSPDMITSTSEAVFNLTLPSVASISVVEIDASVDTIDVDGTVTYTLTLENTGSVTLLGSETFIVDTLLLDFDADSDGYYDFCVFTDFSVGETQTCEYNYTITQADIDLGYIDNDVTVTSMTTIGDTVDDEASLRTPLVPDNNVTFIKTGAYEDYDSITGVSVGDKVVYTFDILNVGPGSISSITIQDENVEFVSSCDVGSGVGLPDLAPGGAVSCTADYYVTQADLDNGFTENTATALFAPSAADGHVVSETAYDMVTLNVSGLGQVDLEVVGFLNSADGNGYADVGDIIDFIFIVNNPGSLTLVDAVVTYEIIGTTLTACTRPTIGPGASVVCPVSYTLDQDDLDAEDVFINATVTAFDKSLVDSYTDRDSADTGLSVYKSVELTKNGTVNAAGDGIIYKFTVENNGDQTFTSWYIEDLKLSPTPICSGGAIAPGDSDTCEFNYTFSQKDVNTAEVANEATVYVISGSTENLQDDDSIVIFFTPITDILFVKTGELVDLENNGASIGDYIRYSFNFTNSGEKTIDSALISDTLFNLDESCSFAHVDPGESRQCFSDYPITQKDIDEGLVRNDASATATFDDGDEETASSSIDIDVVGIPSLDLTVSTVVNDLNNDGCIGSGDEVVYTYVLKNDGHVTFTSIQVDPDFEAPCEYNDPFAPGASVTVCSRSQTLGLSPTFQDNFDAGLISSNATVLAFSTNYTPLEFEKEHNTTLDSCASVTLSKSSSFAGGPFAEAGEVVDIRFTITNDGTQTINFWEVLDDDVDVVFTTPTVCEGTDLLPGLSAECLANYTLTQADINAKRYVNTANVTGDAGDSAVGVYAEASATLPLPVLSDLALLKEDSIGPGPHTLGDEISYSFDILNSGSVTLHNVTLADSGATVLSGCFSGSLAPAANFICSGSYFLNQKNLDDGIYINTATVTATEDDNFIVTTVTATATATTPLGVLQSVGLTTNGDWVDENSDGIAEAGEIIVFEYNVTNDGGATLHNIEVTDRDPFVQMNDCDLDTLAPGDFFSCLGVYVIRLDDVNRGRYESITDVTADAGTLPGTPIASFAESNVLLAGSAENTLVKQGEWVDSDSSGYVNDADTIEYIFYITNVGTTTITAINLTDGLVTPDCTEASSSLPLSPGRTTTCVAVYALDQDDVDAQVVYNEAQVEVTHVGGATSTDEDSDTIYLGANIERSMKMVKLGTPDDPSDPTSITYTFSIENTGTQTLHNFEVTDDTLGLFNVSCPLDEDPLPPGQKSSCTQTYVLTQVDLDRGYVYNTATMQAQSGSVMDANLLYATDSTRTPFSVPSSVVLSKTILNTDFVLYAGDELTYTFTVINTGRSTLFNIIIGDNDIDFEAPCSGGLVGTLDAGETVDCNGTYTLTQDDIDAGSYSNTAVLSALTGTDATRPISAISNTVTATFLNVAEPFIFTKEGTFLDNLNGDNKTQVGEGIEYLFIVENNGTQTIHISTITDFDPRVVLRADCQDIDLDPGETRVCEGRYTVRLVDANNEFKFNEATASYTLGDSASPSTLSATATVILPPGQLIDFEKSTTYDPESGAEVGDTIVFVFKVTNAGSQSIVNASIVDLDLSSSDCLDFDLDPGQNPYICYGEYSLTQADVDAGFVTNTADVVGKEGSDVVDTILASDSISVFLSTASDVTFLIDCSLASETDVAAGETLTITYEFSSTGSTTLSDVNISDTLIGSACSFPGNYTAADGVQTCQESYTLTQDDVDNEQVLNLATFSAQSGFSDDPEFITATATCTKGFTGRSDLTFTKACRAPPCDGAYFAGNPIEYEMTITNNGTLTIFQGDVADPDAVVTACLFQGLAPGETHTCNAIHYVTQEEIDAGSYMNTATATTYFGRAMHVVTQPSSLTVVFDAQYSAMIVKTGFVSDKGDGSADAGDEIQYAITVTANGTHTITGTLTDTLLSEIACPGGAPSPSPAPVSVSPGSPVICTGTYILQQSDVDNGVVENVADLAFDMGLTASATESTTLVSDASISLFLSASPRPSQYGCLVEGDTVVYLTSIVNSGSVSVNSLTTSSVVCPSPSPLGPGELNECAPNPYTVTATDIADGVITYADTAQATPVTPSPSPVSSVASITTPTVPNLGVTVPGDGAGCSGIDDCCATMVNCFYYLIRTAGKSHYDFYIVRCA